MSRQGNEFQTVMKVLYEHMADAGAAVTESVELLEPTSGARREIDILIERIENGFPIRIAVECRDRATKDDVTWVDQVIGKYCDLKINKVILVSSSGFTESARLKATAHNIEVCTVEVLLAKDWPKEFTLLGAAQLYRVDELLKVVLNTDPEIDQTRLLGNLEVLVDGQPPTTLNRLLASCFHVNVRPRVADHLREHFCDIFSVLADLSRNVVFDAPVNFGGNAQISVEGQAYALNSGVFCVRSSFSYTKVEQRHLRHGDFLISTTKLKDDFGGRRLNIIQETKKNPATDYGCLGLSAAAQL
ncbi:MAG TPA: restriction endonuclease [Crinalium sp.]|jgi:hypothetical protein